MLPAQAFDILKAADHVFRERHNFSLLQHTIAFFQTGSHAYGLDTPESDEDYTAIILPPAKYLLGLHDFENWQPGTVDGIDVKAMSLKKFVQLALSGNPNVVEMLFFDESVQLWITDAFRPFLDNRRHFLSREVYKRFSGYAAGQMKKMEQGKFQQFQGHKRKEAVRALGFDAKDGSHLIRLLYTGRDLAKSGNLTPRLGGAARQHTLDIKRGMWSLAGVKEHAALLEQEGETAFHSPACPLPNHPERALIEHLLIETHRTVCQ